MTVVERRGARPSSRDVDLLRAMADRIDQQDPGAFNNLGVLYYSKGMFADAVEAFLRALTIDSRMRTAARNLEVAAMRPGACDARLAAIDAHLADHADDISARRERARLLRLIGRHADATQQLDALIAEDPDDRASLFERGLVEQRAGDLRRAQRWFERAVNVPTPDPIARLHLAEVLYQRGQNEQALTALDAVLATDETIADAHLLRGFVLGDMGRHDAAVAAARQAAALNPSLQALQPHLSIDAGPETDLHSASAQPDGALARYGLGLAFRQRGYFDEARREFERAILQGEDATLSRHALAELDLIGGRYAAARAAYEELLRSHPTTTRYWNEHGVAVHQAGDVTRAAESYRTALRHEPRNAMCYNNLGVALFDLGEFLAAKNALVRAGELDPSLVRAKLNLAIWYRKQDEPLAALALLRELVAFHPQDADAWHAFGVICRDLGWHDEARGALARAIEERPNHAEARYTLAGVLSALGDADGALRETEHALTLSPVRTEQRMGVCIELQRECPDACGPLELLSVRGGDPLQGVALDAADVESLLPDHSVTDEATSSDPVAEAMVACTEADGFAANGVHGEARDRYAQARQLVEPQAATPDAEHYALWRRAAVGEARSRCLLRDGAAALPLLKTLGSHDPRDAEVLALFARSLASSEANQADAVRKTILRILRLEPPSAALMHFVGDTAMQIADDGLALSCYRRALSLDPTRPSPRVAIARLLRGRGDLLAARLELVAALSVAPAWRDALLELAHVHRDADRPHDALALLTRHLATDSADLEALVLLAETLMRLGREGDARIAVTRVLRRAPDDLHALWLEGVLLARQSRLRDALERWRRVAGGEGALAAKAQKAMAKFDAPRLQMVS
jgi:tetratricopeptide (TPR) repeat protein